MAISRKEKVEPRERNAAEYYKDLIMVSFRARCGGIFAAILCSGILEGIMNAAIPGQVYTVLLVWMAISGLYLAVFSFKKISSENIAVKVHYSYYFPGVVMATYLVHYLGGTEWVAFALYFFDLLYANMFLKRWPARIVTGWVFFCYFALLGLEYYGLIPHYRILPMYEAAYNNPRYLVSTNILAVGPIFLLFSYITGFFSKIRRDREGELLIAKQREELRAREFRELSDSLKVRVEENEMLKSRAAEYIRQKEKQLFSVTEDLEHQIETFRKTQRAMQFMIEDLNEMSRELEKVKGHLEEKVKERTEELMEISDKLHRSEKLAFLGKLAGSVTHELRNPMAVIKNAAYFLESSVGKCCDEKTKEYLTMIKKEVTDMDSIIADIMGFAGKKNIKLELTDIKDVVEEALAALNIPDPIKVDKKYNDVPRVMIDSKQLTHAIVNIVNNAIIAMMGKGELGLRILRKNENVCLEISDTGGGIPEEYRNLIFEPLYSTRPKGTGLGLPIAKMMVESQNGKIELSASQAGVGSTFRILLPILEKNPTQQG